MAEYFVNNLIGSDLGSGSELDPWYTIPGMSGSNTVVTGDIINVRNGTRHTGRLLVPTNSLTYRGYGLANNALFLTLPNKDVRYTRTVKIVRSPGVHEGMWILDGSAVDADGVLQFSNTSGTIVEDVQVLGSRIGSRHSVGIGFSSSTVSGATLRRFEVVGAAGNGINVMTKSVTVEWGRVNHARADCIQVLATLANGSRAGATDTFRYLELLEPNFLAPGEPETGSTGDCFQCIAYEGGGNYAFESKLVMHDINCYKSSTGKQLFLFHDALGGMDIYRFRATGAGEKVTLFGPLRGSINIHRFYIEAPCPSTSEGLPTFRFERPNTGAPAWAMLTGSKLNISSGIVVGNHAGLYSTINTEGAAEFDGTINIENITTTGPNVNPFSWKAELALYSSTSLSTFGANAKFNFVNLAFIGEPPTANIRFPVGIQNNPNYVVSNCRFSVAPYNIGSDSYSTVTLFEAAHSYATNNTEQDLQLALDGSISQESFAVGAGIHTRYKIAFSGNQFYNPPSIGATEYERPRISRS